MGILEDNHIKFFLGSKIILTFIIFGDMYETEEFLWNISDNSLIHFLTFKFSMTNIIVNLGPKPNT